MKSFFTIFLILSVAFVASCSHYPWNTIGAIKERDVDQWLNTVSTGEPPEIEVAGKWHDAQGSGFGGWGEGYLQQEQGNVIGSIGGYAVKGVVSGKIVHLAFLARGNVYYTARLKLFQDLLVGNYFYGRDKKQSKSYPMSLEKKM